MRAGKRWHRPVAVVAVAGLAVTLLASCAPQSVGVAVLYRTASVATLSPQIGPWIKIVNSSKVDLELVSVTVRYYFTAEPGAVYSTGCVNADIGCDKIDVAVHDLQPAAVNADRYIEVGFSKSAGSVQPDADSGVLRILVYRSDGDLTDQSDDYSFSAGDSSFVKWGRITAYVDDSVAWGLPPMPGGSKSVDASVTPIPSGPVVTASRTQPAAPSPPMGGSGGVNPEGQPGPGRLTAGVFFDDFTYTNPSDPRFTATWAVRTVPGGPGQPGATWSASTVSFLPSINGSTLRMVASTDGTSGNTLQSEVFTKGQRFFTGTYGARVRFSDNPTGPPGAHVLQTFFTITELRFDNDPLYSAMNFEYLPVGGWGDNRRQLDMTTYYTVDNTTGVMDSQFTVIPKSYDGWHTLVMQAINGTVTYYVDGVRLFGTGGKYYPRRTMAIYFNEWFIDGELGIPGAVRAYEQQVDWVYYKADTLLAPADVQAEVDAHRAAGVAFADAVA
jgi:Cellulose binding domain